jgi:hypothetical protein
MRATPYLSHMLEWIELFAAFAGISAIYIGHQHIKRAVKPDTSWACCETLSGPVMQRRVKGKIETRSMTEDEEQEYIASRAGW